MATADLIVPGKPRSIPAIREDHQFRTNLVLANATEDPVDLDISLIAETGTLLASGHSALPPLGMTQLSRIVRYFGISGDVSGVRAVLSTPTPGGAFTGYAVVIDNVTNDPRTLLPLGNLNEVGEAVWLLPSSARVHGVGGAFYTTDLTIANVGSNDAPFTLKFLGSNRDGRTGIERSLMLSAGMSATYADVLGSVFGVIEGFGAIRVTSANSRLAVSAQTSKPSGDGGTFGQSVVAAAPSDLITYGMIQNIVGIEEDAPFRTNLILSNAVEGAIDVEISLIAETGETLGAQRLTLPPLGTTQIDRVVRELGVSRDVLGARLALSTPTPGGAFAAYASVIDNTTNDPRTLLPQ